MEFSEDASAITVPTTALQGTTMPVKASWLGDSTIVGVNASESERFSFFAPDGSVIANTSRDLPAPDGVEPFERMLAWTTGVELCPKPDGTRFALVYLAFGRIEIYNSLGQLLRVADTPGKSEPVFEEDERTKKMRFVQNSYGYTDCAATDERIVASFSGAAPTAPLEARISGKFIHVVRWDGGLDEVLELDRRVSGLAIDPDGGVIFASSLEDATIYRVEVEAGAWADGRQ